VLCKTKISNWLHLSPITHSLFITRMAYACLPTETHYCNFKPGFEKQFLKKYADVSVKRM